VGVRSRPKAYECARQQKEKRQCSIYESDILDYKANMKIQSKFNKDSLKDAFMSFGLNSAISKSEKFYTSSTDAQWSPLASKIFGFPWVSSVEIKPQEIIIQREDWVDWSMLAEPLNDMIEHHFSFYEESDIIEENQEPRVEVEKEKIVLSEEAKPIAEFIDAHINPQLADHGGRVQLVDYQNSTLYLEMQGGCQGCGMAAKTMRDGIEVAIKKEFPEIKNINDVTLHSEGVNPYYN
jgi:Fe-S cluster biogenesis protein NfuA